MSNVALLLGPIAFRNFEVPASINIGGAQRLAIHRLPGGARVIDALGRDDSDISFSGTFSGPDATLRARSIDEIRAAGLFMPLTWDVFFYSVIINKFEADYRSGWWIPYRISCTIVCAGASSVVASVISLADDALSDVTTACNFATVVGVDLSDTQSALGMPDAAVKGTATYSSTLATLACASALVGTGIAQAEVTFANASWPADGEIPSAAGTLDGIVLAAQQICSLTVAQAYVGRAAINLANASTVTMQTITVTGCNLFQIAATELGDATQWIRIAQLNNISDPMLVGIVFLTIPDTDPGAGGGIAPQ